MDVIDALTDLFILRRPQAFIRSDNCPVFVAEAIWRWIEAVCAKTAYIDQDRHSITDIVRALVVNF